MFAVAAVSHMRFLKLCGSIERKERGWIVAMCISRITYTALGKRAEVLSSHQSGAGEDGRGSLHGDERFWQEADLRAVGRY